MVMIVKFVDAVGSSTTRLDLSPIVGDHLTSDAARYQVLDSLDLGIPDLRVTTADGSTEDGARYLASSYGNRKVLLPLSISEMATVAGRQAATSALTRELDRARNVLMVQADGAAEARWLVTYRAADWIARLRLGEVLGDLSITLDAEPFAYGPLTTMQWTTEGGTFTGTGFNSASDQPPSEGLGTQWYRQTTGPCLGDVDAPLNVLLSPTDDGFSLNQDILVATAPVVFDDATARFHSTSALAATVNAPAQAAVSGASNSDTARLPAAVATGSWYEAAAVTIPQVTVPASPNNFSREIIGRWRILARVRRNTAGDVWQVQAYAGSGFTSGPIAAPTGAVALTDAPITFATPVAQGFGFVDLGILQIPFAQLWQTDQYGDPPKVTPVTVVMYAKRLSGADYLDTDYLLAVPADGRTAILRTAAYTILNSPTGTIQSVVCDADRNSVYIQTNRSGSVFVPGDFAPVPWEGGLPRVSPVFSTRLFVVASYGQTTSIAANKNVTVNPTYRPRYLAAI